MSFWVFLAILAGCCSYTFARGGLPERLGAGMQLTAYVADELVHRYVDTQGYASPALGSITVDALLLVALFVLAVRSTRFWPLWLTGWQAAAFTGHMSKLFDPGMLPVGYAVQAQIWAYPMLLATAAGSWRHQRRQAGGDQDFSWKPLSV